MRYAFAIALTGLLCLGSTAALAGENSQTTLVLHAVETTFGPCQIPDPCPDPTVNVNIGPTIAVYLLARNYNNIAGVQTAFDFPASWVLTFGLWDCQVNQVNGRTPDGAGPTQGTIATAFDCISGGASEVIGRVHMIPLGPGCITQVDSSFPFGTHVVSCAGAADGIDPLNRGTVCAVDGGYNACNPVVPVEPTTWGGIKSHYSQ